MAPRVSFDSRGIEPIADMELFNLLANGFTPEDYALRPLDDEHLLLAFWGLQDLSVREFHTMMWNACYHDGSAFPDERVMGALSEPFMDLATAACLCGYRGDNAVYLDDSLHQRCLDVIGKTDCIESRIYDAVSHFPMTVSYKSLFGTMEGDSLVSEGFQRIRCSVSNVARTLLDSTQSDVRGVIDVVGDGGYLLHDGAFEIVRKYIENEFPYFTRLRGRGVHAIAYDIRNDRLCPEVELSDDSALASFLGANDCVVMTQEGGEMESPLDVSREMYDSGLLDGSRFLVVLSHNKTSVAYRRIRELRDLLGLSFATSCSEYELGKGYDPFGAENIDVLRLVRRKRGDGRDEFYFALSDVYAYDDADGGEEA